MQQTQATLAFIAALEADYVVVQRDYIAHATVSRDHNIRKEAIRAVLRPSKNIRLSVAILDGVEVSETDVESERAAQTLASRRAAKCYNALTNLIRSLNSAVSADANLAAIEIAASRVAGRKISAHAEVSGWNEVTVWLWPTDLTDADQQEAAALGIHYGIGGLTVADVTGRTFGVAQTFAEAVTEAGQRMRRVANPDEAIAEFEREDAEYVASLDTVVAAWDAEEAADATVVAEVVAPSAALIQAAKDSYAVAEAAHTATLKAYYDSGVSGWDWTAFSAKEIKVRKKLRAELWAAHDVTQFPMLAAQGIMDVVRDLSIGHLSAVTLASGRTLLLHHDSSRFATLTDGEMVRLAVDVFADICADTAKSDQVPTATIELGDLLRAQATAAGVSVARNEQHSDPYVAASVAGWIADYLVSVGPPGPDGGERVADVADIIEAPADIRGVPVVHTVAEVTARAGLQAAPINGRLVGIENILTNIRDDRLAAISRGELTSLHGNANRFSDGVRLYTLFSGNPESVYLATLLPAAASGPGSVADAHSEPVPVTDVTQLDGPLTEIQGLPVYISLTVIQEITGGKKPVSNDISFPGSSGYLYELFSGPRGKAWLAASSARQARPDVVTLPHYTVRKPRVAKEEAEAKGYDLAAYQVEAEADLIASMRPYVAPANAAAEMVTTAFTASNPKDVPLPFTQILSAKFTKTTFPRVAIAEVVMFDGLKAVAEVSEIIWGRDSEGFIVSHSTGWQRMNGGACAVRDGKWVRVPSRTEPDIEVDTASPRVPSVDEFADIVSAAARRPVSATPGEGCIVWFDHLDGVADDDDAAIRVGVQVIDGDYVLVDWELCPLGSKPDMASALAAAGSRMADTRRPRVAA